MQFVNNEPEQIEIRKSQNTLIVVGTGIILFSVWTTVKMIGLLFMLRDETISGMRERFDIPAEFSDDAVFWTLVIVIFIAMAVILAVRTYVGRAAIAEGRGKRRGWLYILIAVMMIIGNSMSFLTGFLAVGAPEQLGALTRDQSISTLIVDATSIIMLIQMVISAVRIRKLRRKEGNGKV